ncbi:MAG: hypothetical protein PUF03_12500 [Lachnospiraceae bacterium]|nr:hypothetical protein [Lachnospiraceae bacterium]
MMKTMEKYHSIELRSRKFNNWGTTKSIESRRMISVRKSKTGFADAYVKFS